MMITGSISAQPPCASRRNRRPQGTRGVTLTCWRRATIHQATTSTRPIITPGTMPARNNRVIDTLAATPKIRNPIEGGITGAMMPLAAIRPQARPGS